jgi:protocatechuate 3,4-dioxygenase beta subunit
MSVRRFARGAVVVLVLGAAVATGSGSVRPASAEGETGTFRALTYNVAGLPEGISGSHPAVNTPLISPLLNGYDLVLVQEDWIDPDPPVPPFDFFHDDLISQVTHPYLSEPAPPPLGNDPRRPSALVADGLNRLSRFPFGPLDRVMWPNCFGELIGDDGGAADCGSQKGFSVATHTFATGVTVDVYNLHAEAGGTALDAQYSAEDFEVLARYIQAHSAGHAVIVGGDYNLHTDRPDEQAIFERFLAEAGLTDVCDVVDCGTDADRIDKFVFRSGGGVELQALDHHFEREVFVDGAGAPLSDHDALAVTFRWRRQVPGTVTGVVTDAPGTPLAGVTVGVYAPLDTWLGSFSAVTDANGEYAIANVVPGTYRVLFLPPAGSPELAVWFDDVGRRAEAEPVPVPEAGTVTGIDGGLEPAARVAGTVTDANGNPLASVQVWAYTTEDGFFGSGLTLTDALGAYHLRVAPGTYRILFRAPELGVRSEWFDDTTTRSRASELAVDTGPPRSGVDAVLAPAS